MPLKADTSTTDAAAEQRRLQRAKAEQRSAACEKLRSNLETLLDNPRLRRTTAAGEVERIGEDERQLMISKTQEDLRENCQDQP